MAAGRGRDGQRDDNEAPVAAQAGRQVAVLHDRERPVAADPLERAPRDEEGLVAVDDLEQPRARVHGPLDQRPGPVEPEPEGARAGPVERLLDRRPGAGRQMCVRVQEDEHVAARRRRAGVHRLGP